MNNTQSASDTKAEEYIAAVDIGTTIIRCHIYDRNVKVLGRFLTHNECHVIDQDFIEICPESVWKNFVIAIKKALEDANLVASDLTCMAICTQRGTFTTWDRQTGKVFHNFLTWKDMRCKPVCDSWNNSVTIRCLNGIGKLLHFFTRSKRFLAARIFQLQTGMAISRLLWMFEKMPELRTKAKLGDVCFGTVDTYILWRLTSGDLHVTDASNASITGMFDPFLMKWSCITTDVMGIPGAMLPEVVDSSGLIGTTDASVFGTPIPITAVIGDQQAAMFGECGFNVGDAKCTLGTGTFVNVNTGNKAYASISGIYPVVGWRISGETTYLAEASSFDTGTTVEWLVDMGLISSPADSDVLANSVNDSAGLCFVPAFSGLQCPWNDPFAVSALMGINVSTRPAHIVRSVLESIAFRLHELIGAFKRELNIPVKSLRINGGVSRNKWLMQYTANLINAEICRSRCPETSSLGAAYLAGLGAGIWKNTGELVKLRSKEDHLSPENGEEHDACLAAYWRWSAAVKRCLRYRKIEKDD